MTVRHRIVVLGVPFAGKSTVLQSLALVRDGALTTSTLPCPEPGPFFAGPMRVLHLNVTMGTRVEFICLPGGGGSSWALPLFRSSSMAVAVIDPQATLRGIQETYFGFYRAQSHQVPWLAVITKLDLVPALDPPSLLTSIGLPGNLSVMHASFLPRFDFYSFLVPPTDSTRLTEARRLAAFLEHHLGPKTDGQPNPSLQRTRYARR